MQNLISQDVYLTPQKVYRSMLELMLFVITVPC